MKPHPALALLPFLLAACGGGDRPAEAGAETRIPAAGATGEPVDAAGAPDATRLNACDLLSSSDVATAFGRDFEPGRLEEHGTGAGESYFSICVFDAANETALPVVSLTARVSPEVTDPAAAIRASVQDMRENAMPDYELEPVPALGEGAGWSPMLGQLLLFRRGLMLSLQTQGATEARDRLVGLMRVAVGRLPGGS